MTASTENSMKAAEVDARLLGTFQKHELTDFACSNIVFWEADPEHSTPAEREFYTILQGVLEKDERVKGYSRHDMPRTQVTLSEAVGMRVAFGALNLFKLIRSVGLPIGPEFVDALPFPFWRSSMWTTGKVGKFVSFVGIIKANSSSDSAHPVDSVRSTRYHNCVLIRETPDRAVMLGEDYEKHHLHGLQGIAEMLTLSFIDVDAATRTFRMYCIQGCSRLYAWDELEHDTRVQEEIRTKVIVKGRIPRTKDFQLKLRSEWAEDVADVVARAQDRIHQCLRNLTPLLPVKLSFSELIEFTRIDIAPLLLNQFLDGRTGMSYGFLAFQLPSGPAESCEVVRVLCTRSGCDKQRPHSMDDWVVLSCTPDELELEGSEAIKHITSPSFDSWLILAQAASNLTLARRLKAAGKCSEFVRQVEDDGLAICHFHGFIQRDALPPSMAYFGHDHLPLPCGSIDAAHLTVQEKRAVGQKLLAMVGDVDYLGDVHVEPDHGSVVSCPITMLDRLTRPDVASYGLTHFKTYLKNAGDFHRWTPAHAPENEIPN